MAKAKTNTVPTIKPNSSLMNWLNQESQGAGNIATGETTMETVVAPKEGVEPEVASGKDTLPKSADEKAEQLPVSELVQLQTSDRDSSSQTNDETLQDTASITSPSAPVSRKGKSKLVDSKSYPEIFFKKPVKLEDGTSGGEVKPIRISEDSHWLLSVLVESARRQGNKLTVGDLIENLLTDHREVHKGVVDELINQWKARKRIG